MIFYHDDNENSSLIKHNLFARNTDANPLHKIYWAFYLNKISRHCDDFDPALWYPPIKKIAMTGTAYSVLWMIFGQRTYVFSYKMEPKAEVQQEYTSTDNALYAHSSPKPYEKTAELGNLLCFISLDPNDEFDFTLETTKWNILFPDNKITRFVRMVPRKKPSPNDYLKHSRAMHHRLREVNVVDKGIVIAIDDLPADFSYMFGGHLSVNVFGKPYFLQKTSQGYENVC